MAIIAALESQSRILLVRTGDPSSTSQSKLNELVDADTGETLAQWHGAGIEAATTCDNAIVCACLDGIIYVVRGKDVTKIELTNKDVWPTAGIELSPETALFVGLKGKLIFVDIQSQETRLTSLSDWDVPRPGRDLLGALAFGPGKCYLLGKRELIIFYDGKQCEVLSSSRSEIRFSHCVMRDAVLWVTAKDGLNNYIARYDGRLTYVESPVPAGPYVPTMATCNAGLLVGKQRVYVGVPGSWREIGDVGEPSIIGLIPREDCVVLVTYRGRVERLPLIGTSPLSDE